MRIAVESLSSCKGCQLVFLGLEDYLYDFIGENNISYDPFLMDERETPEVDLALVEGTVRNEEHFRRARRIRERSAQLVALGTCACYGGVQGIANRISDEALFRRRFGEGYACEGEPQGSRRLLPLDSYIQVDAFLPGCPPTADILRSFMELASSGRLPTREGTTVCSECRVTSPPIPKPGPRRVTGAAPVPGKCILEQGFVCMGPVTRSGCKGECGTADGIPCMGCRGPSDAALLSPAHDPGTETLRRLARATGAREDAVAESIKDPAHTFFKFCMAEPVLRRRRPAGTARFIRRFGERR